MPDNFAHLNQIGLTIASTIAHVRVDHNEEDAGGCSSWHDLEELHARCHDAEVDEQVRQLAGISGELRHAG